MLWNGIKMVPATGLKFIADLFALHSAFYSHHPMSQLPASQTEATVFRADNGPVNYGAVSNESPSSHTDTSERQLPEVEGATQLNGATILNFGLFKSLFWDSVPSESLATLFST